MAEVRFATPRLGYFARSRLSQIMGTAVYIVDSDPQERGWIESTLSTSVDAVRTLDDAEGVLALLDAQTGACLLVSVDPSQESALELVRKLRKSGNMIPVIAVGPESAFRTATDIAQLEFTDFLPRPLSAFKLRAAVRRACELTT